MSISLRALEDMPKIIQLRRALLVVRLFSPLENYR